METVKVLAKTSFVSQIVGSVTYKQELTISKELAEHFHGLGLVDLPKKSQTRASATTDGQAQPSVSSPVVTASPTLTLKSSSKNKGGKQS